MIELTLALAETAVRAAQARAAQLGTPMTVTVVDEAGHVVLSARGDGTGFLTTDTSRAKAFASAAYGKTSAELAQLAAAGSAFYRTLPSLFTGQILPTPGGAPIRKGGRLIGGIGCGGGTGEQDQECAEAGARAIGG